MLRTMILPGRYFDTILIIVTSDNGAVYDAVGRKRVHKSNSNLNGAKRWLHEGWLRVPFVACRPENRRRQ